MFVVVFDGLLEASVRGNVIHDNAFRIHESFSGNTTVAL
jgi:hypothetical protein